MKDFFRVNFEQDSASGSGDQGQESLGWRAALPNEFKEHDYVKTFEKPGDFVAKALEVKTEHESLSAKMENAIFKPGEDATTEEVAAYHEALGVPTDPAEYEFPDTGIEHDAKMTDWARQTFKNANLDKTQASKISEAWDTFVSEMSSSEDEKVADEIKAAENSLKEEWKADYDKNLAITQKGFQAFKKESPGFTDLLEMEISPGFKLGNDARMIKVFNAIGKQIADDNSFSVNNPSKQQEGPQGFQSIYKVPNPPKGD